MSKFKIHPVVGGVAPDLRTTYRLKNGILETVSFSGEWQGSVALDGADFSLDGSGVLKLGVGTITITGKNNQTLVWENVPDAKNVCDKLRRMAAGKPDNQPVESNEQSEQSQTRDIPQDIEFSDNVLVFPKIDNAIFYAASMTMGPSPWHRSLCDPFDWVTAGDEIYEVKFRVSPQGEEKCVPLQSPVPGLVLDTYFFIADPSAAFCGQILLPKSVSAPTLCSFFDEIGAVLYDHQKFVLRDAIKDRGTGFANEFQTALNEQSRRHFEVRSLSKDYPHLIDEILNAKPELRGRLAQEAIAGNEQQIAARQPSAKLPKTEVSSGSEIPERQNKAEKTALNEKQKAALRRYEIEMPFSEEELYAKYQHWSKGPEILRPQVNADYETLQPLVGLAANV